MSSQNTIAPRVYESKCPFGVFENHTGGFSHSVGWIGECSLCTKDAVSMLRNQQPTNGLIQVIALFAVV